MTKAIPLLVAATVAMAFTSAAFAVTSQEEAAHKAHDAYLAAINANDLDAFLETVTDDIVFIAPNAPVIEGKAEVGAWVGGYFEAVQTSWEKTSVEFVVTGDWAFERYTYTVVDTLRAGGETYTDTGNGINIYRLGEDGIWRVARDAWATSTPLSGD
jgi:ketosteroid isomerase-like protein